MKKHEKWILLLFVTQLVIFPILYWAKMRAKPTSIVDKPSLIHISPAALIGNEVELFGCIDAPYTLIEFGDYQCPPCAHRQAQVKLLLEEFPTQLRFRFRQYPLEMHKYAMHCALVSEMSRACGLFWKVHDNLYALNTRVSPEQITKMLKRLNVDEESLSQEQILLAKKRVLEDIKLADDCGVNATPSFFLCYPDGRVYKLGELSQVDNFIQ